MTPSGWAVRPAGPEISVARTTQGFQGPLGSALSPSGQKLLSVSSAVTRINSADLFDLRRRRRIGTVPYDSRKGVGESVFYGVAFSPGGKRAWASGGGQNVVHVYAVGKHLREVGQIPAPYFPAGLAYGKTPRGDRIYVANNLSGIAGATNPPGHTVTVIDPKTNHVTKTIDLGLALQPFGVTFARHGRKAYVTNWMGRSVSVIDTRREVAIRRIRLSPPSNPLQADHPNAIAANPKRNEVYTANGNSDTVSVIDTRRDRLIRTMPVSLVRGARTGATPNGLAVSPDGRRLYVALGGENAVAVLDLVHHKRLGFIPTAWNPTDVDITPDGSKLAITTANAAGRQPVRCAGPYAVGDCSLGDLAYSSALHRPPGTKGGISIVRTPRTRKQLRRFTRRVLRNNRVRARQRPKPAYLGAIRHVIYIVKENRTYDQVLGNLGKGDGDPALTLFDDDSAPNHHELARRFTLFDNFYADANVSADGLNWAFGAGVSDYVDKTWPITYSPGARRKQRARDYEQVDFAQQFFTEPLAFDRTIFRGAGALTRGYLWDNAWRARQSFRDYGYFTRSSNDCHSTNSSDVTHLDDNRFGDHVDEHFPGFNLLCSDHTQREPEWEGEFRASEAAYRANPSRDPLPALTLLRLPNDHTYGTRRGRAIPESYMADNDLALGRVVDAVSHSPFWPNTAILVTEDDAQNGPDHVDAHRTLGYVISPYTQRARVDHTHYDTAGMVATLEGLLGMPPMTITDQRAIRMWKGFSRRPNFRPYDALTPKVVPMGDPGAPTNAPSAPLAKAASTWDFAEEDSTPEVALNQAIWKSVHGRRSRMPAPRHDYIIGSQPVDTPSQP